MVNRVKRGSSLMFGSAALALILAAPLAAQAESAEESKGDQEELKEVVTPANTAEAARNEGAAGQVVDQLERVEAEIERNDIDAARTEMDEALEMLQRARIIGSEDLLLSIKAYLEDGFAALEADDLNKAGEAIAAARSEIAKVEQGAIEAEEDRAKDREGTGKQEATSDGGAQLTVVGEHETEALPKGSDAEQHLQEPPLSADETRRRLALGDREIGNPTEVETLKVGDLEGRDVVLDADGEKVGTLGDIVSSGQHVFAIVEHGDRK